MAESQEITTLEQQRQLLITKCEIQRMVLALQFQQVRHSAGYLTTAFGWLKRSVLLLLPGAAAAGFLLTRKQLPFRRWLMKLLLGWTLLRRAKPLWALLSWLVKRKLSR